MLHHEADQYSGIQLSPQTSFCKKGRVESRRAAWSWCGDPTKLDTIGAVLVNTGSLFTLTLPLLLEFSRQLMGLAPFFGPRIGKNRVRTCRVAWEELLTPRHIITPIPSHVKHRQRCTLRKRLSGCGRGGQLASVCELPTPSTAPTTTARLHDLISSAKPTVAIWRDRRYNVPGSKLFSPGQSAGLHPILADPVLATHRAAESFRSVPKAQQVLETVACLRHQCTTNKTISPVSRRRQPPRWGSRSAPPGTMPRSPAQKEWP